MYGELTTLRHEIQQLQGDIVVLQHQREPLFQVMIKAKDQVLEIDHMIEETKRKMQIHQQRIVEILAAH